MLVLLFSEQFAMRTLVITRPDDWHVHLRDGAALRHTVPATAHHFARALVMPNLNPPLITYSAIMAYRQRILDVLDENHSKFTPYMTLYLNEQVDKQDLKAIAECPFVLGAKLYPAGATTNSSAGARSIRALYPLLEIMQRYDLVLQIHGEVTHGDIFEREALFIDQYLTDITHHFPDLRIVLEHISTQVAVEFVTDASAMVAATITPQHLLHNRNKLLAGGIRPHYYCLPILKHQRDQIALQNAAISGNSKFFAGTDSAPHAKNQKEHACGCAGVYSAPYAVAFYAELFDSLGQLTRLNEFLSIFGARFYQLPMNTDQLELIKQPQMIPQTLAFGNDVVIPLDAGNTLQWSIREPS